MWTASNGHSRALVGVATAGVIAMAVGGITGDTAISAADHHSVVPSASVVAPVELTALTSDSSLMDIIGELTGLNWIIPLLDDPDNPLFPIVIGLEALGELFVVIPLTLLVGTPLLLITEGWQGVEDTITLLGTAADGVKSLFDNLVDWYETRNWLTGELLDPGSSEAGALSGLGDVFHTGSWDDVFTPVGFDAVPTVDGFDAGLADVGLGDLGEVFA